MSLCAVRLRQDFGGQTSPSFEKLQNYASFHSKLACQTKPWRSLVEAGGVEVEAEKSFYLGETGESFFIRISGKGDLKTVNLISRSTFALVDAFFTSEEEARLFAAKRNLRIVDFDESARLNSPH